MGMAPVPPLANLFMAIAESADILPAFKPYLPLYVRFIDDGLVAWKRHLILPQMQATI